MEFIKRMKKREFIEMSLKALAGLMLAFIAIILMEGMIYGITLNAYKEKSKKQPTVTITENQSVVYCIKDGKNDAGEDLYFVLIYNEGMVDINDKPYEWSPAAKKVTKAQAKTEYAKAKEIIWKAPSAFELTITPTHYIVITLFVLAVGGAFTYVFFKLAKSYKEMEETYKKTGTIEITNK